MLICKFKKATFKGLLPSSDPFPFFPPNPSTLTYENYVISKD